MKTKERYAWLAVSAVVLATFAVLTFSPTVLAQSNPEEETHYLQTFEDVFRFVSNNYVEEVDPKTLFEGAMNGMFGALDDAYSYYLDQDDMADLSDTTDGRFGGVGLIISKQTAEDKEDADAPRYVEVVSPIEGTPAFRAGIRAGDLITMIENESTEDYTIDDVVDRLRGQPGTRVQVTISRNGNSSFDVTLERAIIEVPTVKSEMIDDSIAYLRIIQFTPYTDDRVETAVEEFAASGYRSLVIDLRNNPGGLLKSVVDISDYFLRGGTIVSTRSRIPTENHVYTASQQTMVPDTYPIVVLINKGSASASEILAGAVRDNDRGIIIGQTSFGKGSVQQVRQLENGTGIKLTTSRYFTPDGNNIDKVGIDPDITVQEPITEDERAIVNQVREEDLVGSFVLENPRPTDNEIQRFVRSVQSQGFDLDERIIRRLVREEINRTNNDPPVYDLEYDLTLRRAVELLRSGEYQEWIDR